MVSHVRRFVGNYQQRREIMNALITLQFIVLAGFFSVMESANASNDLSYLSRLFSMGTHKTCEQIFTSAEDPQGRGCCSWHGRVCGCEFGRAKCCDGALSPSCGC